MNIIAPSTGEIRFVNYSPDVNYDVNTIKLYIQGTNPSLVLEYQDINGFDKTHTLLLTDTQITDSGYQIYSISYDYLLPAMEYRCVLMFMDSNNESVEKEFALSLSSESFDDQHDYIEVKERTLASKRDIAETLIAGDNRSECITFKINRCYDGISFLDSSRKISVDYVPAKWSDQEKKNGISFYSSGISSKTERNDGDQTYLLLQWIVPERALRDQGTLKIALSVEATDYLWQTSPLSLTVKPNIGLRGSAEIAPEKVITLTGLNDRISIIEQSYFSAFDIASGMLKLKHRSEIDDITEYENVSIISLLEHDAADEDVFFNGYDAPEGEVEIV